MVDGVDDGLGQLVLTHSVDYGLQVLVPLLISMFPSSNCGSTMWLAPGSGGTWGRQSGSMAVLGQAIPRLVLYTVTVNCQRCCRAVVPVPQIHTMHA